ncbi:MAG: M48 family peptidase [Burkholderiales bacterium]|nr:MAG: M48 family peptidase [Burkholderiales bacterium]
MPIPHRPVGLRARLVSAALAIALALGPVPVAAQIENLPRLGDPSADELSPQAERRLGESIMRQIRRDAAWLDDADLVDYLNRLAAPLSATPAAGSTSFEFFALAEASINAFALPGGYIGVHTGLLTAAETESEVAAVLAHEIGHVTQRHIARMLAQQKQVSLVSMAGMVLALLAARSNPQAAMGSLLIGGEMARSNMLSFSREAEREADRVGFEILRQADFDVQSMVSFFGRLQQASRFYESNAPAYMRTHPVTGERIGDMQLRLRESRYRQRADSIEFQLLRARLRALADDSAEGRRTARALAEQSVRQSPKAGPAPWFGLASVAAAQRDWARVETALAQAQSLVGSAGHPYLEVLGASARLESGDARGAADRATRALARFPDARSLARVQGEALIAAGQPGEALRLINDHLLVWRGDARLWALSAQANFALGRRAEAHRAVAEQYLLLGSPMSALDQLRRGQKAGDTDFYAASMIDSRIREIEPDALREFEETRQQGQQR